MHVFERILSAGQPFGLTMAGMHAMNSCRMEKGYRHWGDDIGIEDTPINAGLEFAVAWNKPVNFIGREALLNYKSKEQKTHRTLLQFRLICSERLMYKEEPIYLNGKRITQDNVEWYRQHFSAIFYDFYLFDSFLGFDRPNLDQEVENYLIQLQLAHKVTVKNGVLSTTELSQGQRKRLALLTAYLEDRPIYVFDEWAADQEPRFRELFYKQILLQLKERGKIVIVISHDERYFHLADHIIKLDYGAVESEQTVQQSGSL
jgi:ABC-type lipoprotein export system ATPase subunit